MTRKSRAKAVLVEGQLVAKRTITEADLLAVETARQELAAIKAAAERAKAKVDALENDITLRLKAGARITGRMVALISRIEGPRRPPWKDLYLDHMSATHQWSRDALENMTIFSYPGQPHEALVIGPKPGHEH